MIVSRIAYEGLVLALTSELNLISKSLWSLGLHFLEPHVVRPSPFVAEKLELSFVFVLDFFCLKLIQSFVFLVNHSVLNTVLVCPLKQNISVSAYAYAYHLGITTKTFCFCVCIYIYYKIYIHWRLHCIIYMLNY